MPATAPLRVELLGGFRVVAAGGSPARRPSARQQQVLAFLVLHARHAPVPRHRIGGSLWPESTDVQSLTNLRRELHHLREGCPELDASIEAGTRTLAWRARAGARVDVVEFEAAAERGLAGDRTALQDAAVLYKGDLLPDCAGEWIDPDRERLRQQATQVLTRLLELLEAERAFGAAIERAHQLLRLDPVNEHAWCALMRCHARRDERATALHLYQECTALMKKELGVQPSAATRLTYREILDLDAELPAVPAPPRTAVYPLVGRQSEWRLLLDAWRLAASGETRLFLIRGEAGIGKTRLAEELMDWSRLNAVTPVTSRCYAGEGRLAYAPIAAWLGSDALRRALMNLDASWATDVARLRPELLVERPEIPPPDRHLESWQRLRFFEALAQAFRSAAPLLLVLDDVQWADGDTLEWLHYFMRSAAGTRCLVVGTVRAGEEQDNPALGRLLGHLERDGLLATLALGPLDRTATAQLAGEVTGQPLDESAVARAFRETEGHPLFIIERGHMELAAQPGSAGQPVGPEVQSVVAARLALLSQEARAVAEVAAAVGRDFRFDILAQASDLEEDALVRALDELWRRHIVRVQSDERWDFSHDRIREVAYSGIGPARRRLVHRRIAQGMELLFADRLDDVSASIALHLERGGQPARAVAFLERAAAAAMRLSATEEAIHGLTHALSLLETLPAGRERDERELALRWSLSVALNAGRGYAAPEIERNLERVFALSRADGRAPSSVPWLWVAFTLRFMLGDLKAARDVASEALSCSVRDSALRCEAHLAMAGILLNMGELEEARTHFDDALGAYDERRPQTWALASDFGVFAPAWSAHALWLLGREDEALARADGAIARARRLNHPYSETLALAYAALLHQMRLDVARMLPCAQAAAALCDRFGFGYYGDWARVLMGWAQGRERPAEGIAMIETALARLDADRAQARRPYYLSLLADTCQRLGDRDRAAAILDTAMTMAVDRGDLWWMPSLCLLRSQLVADAAREPLLQRGLAVARAQHSRALELRILAFAPARTI